MSPWPAAYLRPNSFSIWPWPSLTETGTRRDPLMSAMGGKQTSITSPMQRKPVLRHASVELLPGETAFHCFGWLTGEPPLGVCE